MFREIRRNIHIILENLFPYKGMLKVVQNEKISWEERRAIADTLLEAIQDSGYELSYQEINWLRIDLYDGKVDIKKKFPAIKPPAVLVKERQVAFDALVSGRTEGKYSVAFLERIIKRRQLQLTRDIERLQESKYQLEQLIHNLEVLEIDLSGEKFIQTMKNNIKELNLALSHRQELLDIAHKNLTNLQE